MILPAMSGAAGSYYNICVFSVLDGLLMPAKSSGAGGWIMNP